MDDGRPAKACPACGDGTPQPIGALPALSGLIGLEDPGWLHECIACGLRFRHPYPDSRELAERYRDAPAAAWESAEARAEFRLARRWITGWLIGGDVLDVGCFSGEFLESLPAGFARFGVEPAEAARTTAAQRGVVLVGRDVGALDADRRYDAICLFDLIEHVPEPLALLANLTQRLRPGGLVILSTGNARSLLWRRLLPLDYYYYYPEHCTFLSPRWLRWAAPRAGLELIRWRRFRHLHGGFHGAVRQARLLAIYLAQRAARRAPALHRRLQRLGPFRGSESWPCAPQSTFWPDHFLAALRRHA